MAIYNWFHKSFTTTWHATAKRADCKKCVNETGRAALARAILRAHPAIFCGRSPLVTYLDA